LILFKTSLLQAQTKREYLFTYILLLSGTVLVLVLVGSEKIHVGDLILTVRTAHRWECEKYMHSDLIFAPKRSWHPILVFHQTGTWSTFTYIIEKSSKLSCGTAALRSRGKGGGHSQESEKECDDLHGWILFLTKMVTTNNEFELRDLEGAVVARMLFLRDVSLLDLLD